MLSSASFSSLADFTFCFSFSFCLCVFFSRVVGKGIRHHRGTCSIACVEGKCSLPDIHFHIHLEVAASTDSRVNRESKMAPPKEFTVEPTEKRKGKSVRFADDEGHDLCEIFQISRLSDRLKTRPLGFCVRDKNWTWRPLAQKRPKPMSLYSLPWNPDELYNRIARLNVSLENVVKTQKGIIGMIAVKNIAYCKEVSVTFSFDNWQTHRETEAVFYRQDEEKELDFFVFVVCDKAACFDRSWQLDFAIRYKAAAREYWDNNDGNNYAVQCD